MSNLMTATLGALCALALAGVAVVASVCYASWALYQSAEDGEE